MHDYGDVCQAITDLAMDLDAPIGTSDFRTLNACLDDAIAVAVTQYARERDQTHAEGEALRGTERLGFFAHELRNLLNTALLAFEAIRSGHVAVAGSTGMVLQRSLTAAETLIVGRWAIEANGGRVYGRSLPGTGCVFTIDLPRLHAMAVAGGGAR